MISRNGVAHDTMRDTDQPAFEGAFDRTRFIN
jgi:hypothetical protein